jgi:hypothetical protein
MNAYVPQSLVWDHIRESRQQAAAARKVSAARGAQRRTGTARRTGVHARRIPRGA